MTIIKPYTSLLNSMNLGPSSTGAASGGVIDLTPGTDFSWADEITWYVFIHAVNGSPTAGNLTAKCQIGAMFSASLAAQFSSTLLADLDAAQKVNLYAEGEDWPASLAAFGIAAPALNMRTIRGFGVLCNLHLDASTLSGGTSPTFTISAGFSAKGV